MRQWPHAFGNPALEQQALTHRSAGKQHNERLEFLGDAILDMVISEYLFDRFPKADEGELSRRRARLVRGESLARLGRELELGKILILGPGELRSGGHRRNSSLADAVEALIAATYLDAGFDRTKQVILELFAQRLESLPDEEALKDPKTRLQELLQSKGAALPQYAMIESWGDDHERMFRCSCTIELLDRAFEGQGSSRKKAEQESAEAALKTLQEISI